MVIWFSDTKLISYPQALESMETHVDSLVKGEGQEKVWLLEHPPLYTAGTSSKMGDLLDPNIFPVYHTGRGGQFTYHGPGQRVAYVMIDLNRREQDLRQYVYALEQWIIDTLQEFGIHGERREGRIGIWVSTGESSYQKEAKIAAVGVRVRKWITYHGIALNVHPNLGHFSGIVPCGLSKYGVTSLHALGKNVSLSQVDEALELCWERNSFLNHDLS